MHGCSLGTKDRVIKVMEHFHFLPLLVRDFLWNTIISKSKKNFQVQQINYVESQRKVIFGVSESKLKLMMPALNH